MSIRFDACGYCRGRGKAEFLVERTSTGEWVDNFTLSHEIADEWIRLNGTVDLRWEPCPCPKCGGTGTVELEFFPCKIF